MFATRSPGTSAFRCEDIPRMDIPAAKTSRRRECFLAANESANWFMISISLDLRDRLTRRTRRIFAAPVVSRVTHADTARAPVIPRTRLWTARKEDLYESNPARGPTQ